MKKRRAGAYNGREKKKGARMLSTGEILLLNQLLYCPKEKGERRTVGAYQGSTIRVLAGQWLIKPLPDEAECGTCLRGKEWNRIIRLIAESPRLSDMRIENVHRDEADGGGGGLSAVFTNHRFGEAVVVFRGTAAGEWRDDFLGGAVTGQRDGVSTAQQENALTWYHSLGLDGHFSEITVTGHSKGGNKAQYIALMEEPVSRCVSFDGQGFSDEFVKKYRQKIRKRQHVIENHNMEYDYVNILLNHVGRSVYYQESPEKEKGFWETHCPNAFFWFGEENTCFLVRSEKGEAEELQELNRFFNSCLRSLPEKKKIAAMELFGTLAQVRLGNTEKGPESERKDRDYLISLFLKGENPDVLVYLLAYLLKYQQVEPKLAESVGRIGERFGLLRMQRLVRIIEEICDWKYSDVLMRRVGILTEAVPEAFWDGMQDFLQKGYGIAVSGEDLRKMAVRISRVMRLRSQIRIIPGEGEDMR